MGWRVSSSKMWSLGKFKPTELSDPYDVGREFRVWARQRLSSLKVSEIRDPDHPYSVKSDIENRHSHLAWHHDFSKDGARYLVLWANTAPTFIRLAGEKFRTNPSDTVYQGKPWEVLLIDNLFFQHQSPNLSLEVAEKRWFIRSTVHSGGIVRDVPDVYQYLT